ncbi:MAG: hypothetical protein KJ737_14270 [Proteobacteria bacterium]|nr:hypothetical protein [Pseudomonadota bacterium]
MAEKKTLGEILVHKNLVSAKDIDNALRIQTGGNRRLGYILIKMGLIADDQLFEALSDQQGIPVVDIEREFSSEVERILPRYLCRKYSAIPVSMEEKNVLNLAMVNPLDQEAISDIDNFTGLLVKPLLAKEKDIANAISTHIPFLAKDIFNPLIYSKLAQAVTALAIVLLVAVCFYVYKDIQIEKYGYVSTSGELTVYSNHETMVGVEGNGAISLIGHGPYAKGFYSVVFDNSESLKAFIDNKKNNFSDAQYQWLTWVAENKLPAKGK